MSKTSAALYVISLTSWVSCLSNRIKKRARAMDSRPNTVSRKIERPTEKKLIVQGTCCCSGS
ncbi:hypothetical protein BP00DRAFT_142872 [Aspergillus indologenus CBS 114.80]|uniref:Uncharacterized protein n=1 Tax=Aspergillus indologenus CBS 114.80 TaxID=1450541 RepID=A0A2V5ICC8_9EURO|nr:hypothetical protein BP00DRAFT_142872 [Aspergillus indologenus CBS 114.80]